jgi:hypothetical protein
VLLTALSLVLLALSVCLLFDVANHVIWGGLIVTVYGIETVFIVPVFIVPALNVILLNPQNSLQSSVPLQNWFWFLAGSAGLFLGLTAGIWAIFWKRHKE